jgi:uncharacterized repeat protein (TIGR01451 family)
MKSGRTLIVALVVSAALVLPVIAQDGGYAPGGVPESLPAAPAAAPDVTITKQALGTDFRPGDPITFTLTISNIGTEIAAHVVVSDMVPSQVVTPHAASTLAITPTGVLSYVWDIEALGVGQSGVITIYGQIDPHLGGSFAFANRATISDPGDESPHNNTSSVTIGGRTYLPLGMREWPPLPEIPTLNPIPYTDRRYEYTISWSAAERAEKYVLEEDDDPAFSDPQTLYVGPATSYSRLNPPGTYYHRVKARNAWGDSGWSNTESATVVTGLLAFIWVDNLTDETITVQVVGIEKRDFAPGLYHWLTLPAGTYTVRAWALGYSYKFTDYFYEKVTLGFN